MSADVIQLPGTAPAAAPSLNLTPAELVDASGGYRRPADQLRALHSRGFVRAFRVPAGRVVLERAHYEAVKAGEYGKAAPSAPTPAPWIPPARRYLAMAPLAINYEGLKTGFRRAREAAGMPWVTFHDLRRSCATLMIQAPGADLFAVSKLLGHSTVAVTQARYAHLQVDQVRAGLEAAFTQEIAQEKQKRPRKAA